MPAPPTSPHEIFAGLNLYLPDTSRTGAVQLGNYLYLYYLRRPRTANITSSSSQETHAIGKAGRHSVR